MRRGRASRRYPVLTGLVDFGHPSAPIPVVPDPELMAAVQFIVEGGHRLRGAIRPSGNKNAALPIVAAALLTDQPVELDNVPRIADIETLCELLRSVGASVDWTERHALRIHAREVRAASLDPVLCAKIRASILLAGPSSRDAGR